MGTQEIVPRHSFSKIMDDTSSRCICCIEFSDSCSIWINGRKYSRWIRKTRHQCSTRKNCRARSCWTKSKLLRLIFCLSKIATSQCQQFTCTLNNKRNIRFLPFYLQFIQKFEFSTYIGRQRCQGSLIDSNYDINSQKFFNTQISIAPIRIFLH